MFELGRSAHERRRARQTDEDMEEPTKPGRGLWHSDSRAPLQWSVRSLCGRQPPRTRMDSRRSLGLLAIQRPSDGSLAPLKSDIWSFRPGDPRAIVQHQKGQVQGTARRQPATSQAVERGRGAQLARQQPHSVSPLAAPRARHPMHAPGAQALVPAPHPPHDIAIVAVNRMPLFQRRDSPTRIRWRPHAIVVAVRRSLRESSKVLASHVAFPDFVFRENYNRRVAQVLPIREVM